MVRHRLGPARGRGRRDDAIEPRFANGTVERRLILVDSIRTDGTPATPQKGGLILGDREFFTPDS